MSRRTKQQPAASRRTRRAEQPQAFAFAETQKVVSNPIFYCGTGASQSKPAPPSDQLRCAYGSGAVRALVHDPAGTAAATAAGSGIGNGKPLPLPPCRAHRAGSAAQFVVGGPRVRVLRRGQHQDPFLAAYVACSKMSGVENGGKAKRQQEKRTTKKNTTATKGEKGEVVVPGCGGVWNGWAASARYAGAVMSCKNVCAVDASVHARDAPAKAGKEEEAEEGPTLDLSWAPVVLSARAMERRREQRY